MLDDKKQYRMIKDKTLVLGASENPERYSNIAILRLLQHGKKVVAVGKKSGEVNGLVIQKEIPLQNDIDTVTLYLNPNNQKEYYAQILALQPNRIIFNPGTENAELEILAQNQGINTLEACTLVMLSTGQY